MDISFNTVSEITLCVNSENEQALNLYKRVGFKEKHQLIYYTKRC